MRLKIPFQTTPLFHTFSQIRERKGTKRLNTSLLARKLFTKGCQEIFPSSVRFAPLEYIHDSVEITEAARGVRQRRFKIAFERPSDEASAG